MIPGRLRLSRKQLPSELLENMKSLTSRVFPRSSLRPHANRRGANSPRRLKTPAASPSLTWTPQSHPGDNFYLYANLEATSHAPNSPADRRRPPASSASSPTAASNKSQRSSPTQPNPTPPAGSNERKIADLYRSYIWMRPPSEIPRTRLAKTPPRLHRDHPHPARARQRPRSSRSAPTSTPSISPTSTPTISSASWVAPSFNDPDHYAPYLLQGRHRTPRPRLLPLHQR